MLTLFLWLNQKVFDRYNAYLESQKRYKEKLSIREAQRAADALPDYLKRDMGIAPYGERLSKDKKI
ncbi:hypothetical protein [Marinomonas mediterranea]|uniref:hypothetical protein n=1 Tax=Marinomonas mediterranea TaxID=119864 RepID=UPI00234AF036|nr:hypothetical protein [Marinomonas mediterranea]WCN07441.1 hypothetical protein GV055_00170 [Marinomonas mediterranea]